MNISSLKIKPGLKIFLAYLGLALLVTFPLVLQLKSHALGDPKSDMWKHIWGFWWVKDNLLKHFTFPLHTTLLNFPKGGSIFFIDSLGAVLSIPLQLLFGLIPAYNLMIILNLALAGYFAYLLCFYLGKNRFAAFIGGLIFGFSAYFYSNLISGITEALNIPWIPLFLLYFIKSLREKGWRNPLLCSLCLFLATFGSWYHGLFCGLLAGFIGFSTLLTWLKKVYRARKDKAAYLGKIFLHILIIGLLLLFIGHWKTCLIGLLVYIAVLGLTEPQLGPKILKAQWIARLFLIGLTAAVLLAPLIYYFQQTLSQPDALVIRNRMADSFTLYLGDPENSSRIADYFLPGKNRGTVSLTVDRLTKISYSGYLVLLLALWGLIKTRRRYQLTFALSSLLFFLLSLGPYLKWPDSQDHSVKNYLYLVFYKFLPFFSQAGIPFRFTLMVNLCLGVLASFALAGFFRFKAGRLNFKIAAVLVMGIFLESILLSPVPFPLPESRLASPKFYLEAGRDSRPYGLIDYPIQRGEDLLLPGEYFYYQTFHHKGIPYNVEGTIPTPVYENLFTLYLFNLEKKFELYMERTAYAPPKDEMDRSFKKLKAAKYRYLVLHLNYYPRETLPAIRTLLRHYCGEPRLCPPDLEVYQTY